MILLNQIGNTFMNKMIPKESCHFLEKYEPKLKFPGGEGMQFNKNLLWGGGGGGLGILWNYTSKSVSL